jgi:[ribosomal protein S5]-alanine N-acetyltransferase
MNVELSLWTMDDLPQLVRLANNSRISDWMTDAFPHPYDEEAGKKFITFAGSQEPKRIFKIMVDGQTAGSIGIHPQQDISRRNAELGYWIAEPFWGKGVATQAVKLVIPVGFSLPGITRLYARPFSHNPASQRVLEKNGFTLEATIKNGFFKNGSYCDELIYGLRKEVSP